MIVGIDLGTTNSAIACFRDGAPVLIPNALGDLLTPSAVSVGKDGALLVGLAARERQPTHPELTATAFKRHMGTRKRYALGRRAYGAEDLSALVLASLKADAERWTGEKVTGAVITVPAYFNDQQRKATRRAGEIAGLKVERLVNEPTAAALAYGIHERGDREPFLVFDLGGGTFDVSIVEVFGGVVEVRASAGDNRLGGEDFNDVISRLARAAIDPGDKLASRAKAPLLDEVMRAAAERTRRALSDAEEAGFEIVWEGKAYSHRITAADFEAAAEPLLQRLRDPVLRSMRDSNIPVGGLSEVVLVGGATRMPIVRRAVTRMFGRFPNHALHPDHAVALGAAVQAGLKARDAALEEIRLTDVCPFTLGVDMAVRDRNGGLVHGVFAPIIERNTVVPASRVHRFQTLADNQKQVQFNVYQGEARDVSENVSLGQVAVPVPPRPAGEVAVDVRFSYDASGMLEVDVSVPMSGLQRQWVISDGDGGDTPEEIAARRAALAELKIHPRDEAANAATLARAERCYENFLGERRQYISELILAFEAALARQEPHAIDEMRGQVEAALDQIEGERFLWSGSPWPVLGIASTDDDTAIRLAYARKLKTIDVDDSPGEFIALREALNQARAQAARRRAQPDAESGAAEAVESAPEAVPPEPVQPEPRPSWIVDIEAVQALIFGEQSREAIYDEVVERSNRIFSGPEMDDIAHATQVEQWAAQVILSGVPRSNALLGTAIGRFGWLKRYGQWDSPPIVRAVVDRYSDTLLLNDLQDGKSPYSRAYRMMWMSKPSGQYADTVEQFIAMLRAHYPTVIQELPPEKLAAWEQLIAHRHARPIARLGRWRDRTWARAMRFARRFHLDRLFAGAGMLVVGVLALALVLATHGVALIFLLPALGRASRR